MEQASNDKNYTQGFQNKDKQKSLEITVLMVKQQKSVYFTMQSNLSLLSGPKT